MRVGDLDLTLRQWEERDYPDLLNMVCHCLEVNYAAGADMLGTPKNAIALTKMGMLAAAKGEPCLILVANNIDCPGPIGYTLWCELPNPLGLDFRGRVLHGLGTYVMPTYQRRGLSHILRNAAEAQGGRLGFTKVVGVAYHDAGLESVLARNYRVAGTHVEKELSC